MKAIQIRRSLIRCLLSRNIQKQDLKKQNKIDGNWSSTTFEFLPPRQQAALKQKRSSKLDEAMSEASARAPAAKAVDACFVIDCTYSMRDTIEAAKQKVSEIQRRICSLLGHGGNVRFAIVAYRDHQFDTNIEVLPFRTFGRTSSHLESRVGTEAMNMKGVGFLC